MQVVIEPVIQVMGISGQHWHLQDKGWYCTMVMHHGSKYISSILYFGDILIIVHLQHSVIFILPTITFIHNNVCMYASV